MQSTKCYRNYLCAQGAVNLYLIACCQSIMHSFGTYGVFELKSNEFNFKFGILDFNKSLNLIKI